MEKNNISCPEDVGKKLFDLADLVELHKFFSERKEFASAFGQQEKARQYDVAIRLIEDRL